MKPLIRVTIQFILMNLVAYQLAAIRVRITLTSHTRDEQHIIFFEDDGDNSNINVVIEGGENQVNGRIVHIGIFGGNDKEPLTIFPADSIIASKYNIPADIALLHHNITTNQKFLFRFKLKDFNTRIPLNYEYGFIVVLVRDPVGTIRSYTTMWKRIKSINTPTSIWVTAYDIWLNIDNPIYFVNRRQPHPVSELFQPIVADNNNNNNYNFLLRGEELLARTDNYLIVQVRRSSVHEKDPGIYFAQRGYIDTQGQVHDSYIHRFPSEIETLLMVLRPEQINFREINGGTLLTFGEYTVAVMKGDSLPPDEITNLEFLHAFTYYYDKNKSSQKFYLYKNEVKQPNQTVLNFVRLSYNPVDNHVVAVTSNGQGYCWGNDEHGQCGIPANKKITTPQLIDFSTNNSGKEPFLVDGLAAVNNSFYLSKDGHVYAQGEAITSTESSLPVEVKLPKFPNNDVAAAIYHQNYNNNMVVLATLLHQYFAIELNKNSNLNKLTTDNLPIIIFTPEHTINFASDVDVSCYTIMELTQHTIFCWFTNSLNNEWYLRKILSY